MMNVLIADDHFAVRLGVEIIVDEILKSGKTIDFASDATELLQKVNKKPYDILITDLNMPGSNGTSIITKVLSANVKCRVIVLTVNAEEHFAERCFQAGARAFIHKGTSEQELKTAIQTVMRSHFYISEKQKSAFASSYLIKREPANQFRKLSERELEVAQLILKGLGVLEIANALSISISTASTFKQRLFRKLNVTNLIDFANVASRQGFSNDEAKLY